MIITQKKPIEELLGMLEGVKKVAIVGCANCAAACQTGGEKEIQEMKAVLEANGMEVVATVLPDECCHKMLVKRDTKILRTCGAEAVVGMACGDGVQTVADNVPLPIYPANNTLFLGQVERVGIFHEDCRMCGECVLEGPLCREPTYRRTPLGREICDVMLAVPRGFRRADYLPCILWGRTAQQIATCHTRDKIRICGRLQSRAYTKLTEDGPQERIAYEISALNAEIIPE